MFPPKSEPKIPPPKNIERRDMLELAYILVTCFLGNLCTGTKPLNLDLHLSLFTLHRKEKRE